MVGDQAPSRDPDAAFADQVRQLVRGPSNPTTEEQPKPLAFPPAFRPLADKGMGRRFCDYLRTRHYSTHDIAKLAHVYRLQYATTGPYGYRLIVPVYTDDGLMSWTGRTISERDEVRYKSHSGLDYWPNDPPPIWNIHDLLLNEHDLSIETAEVLVVAEGPFDGMRLDYVGYPHIRGTCFFGKSVSRLQATKLNNLGVHYKRKWVLLDEDAKIDALRVQSQLEPGGFRIRFMEGGKDPAALSENEINRLIDSL
jgi:hypothetical protein